MQSKRSSPDLHSPHINSSYLVKYNDPIYILSNLATLLPLLKVLVLITSFWIMYLFLFFLSTWSIFGAKWVKGIIQRLFYYLHFFSCLKVICGLVVVVAHVIIVSAPLKIIGFFLCWCSWPSPTHLFVLTPMVMFERAMLWSLYLSYSSLHNLAKLWPQAPNESLWSLHNYVVDKEKWLHILSWLGHNQRLKLQKWTQKI